MISKNLNVNIVDMIYCVNGFFGSYITEIVSYWTEQLPFYFMMK